MFCFTAGFPIKTSEQTSGDNTQNEPKIVHKSLFDAISSTQRVNL